MGDAKNDTLSDVRVTLESYLLLLEDDPFLEIGADSSFINRFLHDIRVCLSQLYAIEPHYPFKRDVRAFNAYTAVTNSLSQLVDYLRDRIESHHGAIEYTRHVQRQLLTSLAGVEALLQMLPVESSRQDIAKPTPTRKPRQIFLSHAMTDSDFAHRLADDLRAKGWQVWIAPESIHPGEKWVEAINRGLEESGVFVVALTPNAVASRWVNTETSAAIDMEHRNLIRFMLLDVVACDPPQLWAQYQYLSFRGGYQAGLSKLLTWLEQDDTVPSAPSVHANTGKASPSASIDEKRLPAEAQYPRPPELREILKNHFNKTDLKELAQDLDINYQELNDQSLTEMALSLIQQAEHRGRYEELVEKVRKLRPHLFPPENRP